MMSISKLQAKMRPYVQYLFWAAVIIELAVYTLKKFDMIFEYQTWILRLVTALLLLKILLTEYTRKEWIFIFALLVLGAVAYLCSGRGIDTLFRASALILASKGMDGKKVFFAVWVSILIVFIGWGVQSFLGMRTLYQVGQFGRGENELRYCFGYSHPNTFHYAAWELIAIGIYLWHDKMKNWYYMLLLAFTLVITYLTRSRTGGILLCLTILLFWIAGRWGRKKEGKKRVDRVAGRKRASVSALPYLGTGLLTTACMLFSALPMIFGYKDNILWYVNAALNNRLEMARGAILHDRIIPVSLFSRPENEALIDMGFIRIFYTFGVIPTVLFVGCIGYLIVYAYRKQNLCMLILMIMTVCYTTLEAVQINSGMLYNFVILLMLGTWAEYREVLGKSDVK